MPLTRENLVIYNGLELEEGGDVLNQLSPLEAETFRVILQWTKDYLNRSHPDLGREGPVCPFTQPSLLHSHYWLTVVLGEEIELHGGAKVVTKYRDWFFELEPKSGSENVLKTIVIVFPELTPQKAIVQLEALHKFLKPGFVKKGIMLGQFYKGCPDTGLWNDHFHPLESPLPLLAIRNMVPSDFPFLHGKRGGSEMLIAYLNRFGTNIPPDVKKLMVQALESSNLKLRSKTKS